MIPTDTPGRELASRREFLRKVATGAALAACAGLGAACGPSLSHKLTVEPSRARADEPFVVRVRDLAPGARVVLSAAFDDTAGGEWSSTAVFEADSNGRVDTSKQAPAEGSYRAKDPMGLVWSALGPGGGYLPALRSSPVRVSAETGGEEATARVERYSMADGAERTEVREDGLAGSFFSPAGGGPAPAVLVLGGSDGGLSPYTEREAAFLASEGYASLALAYFKGDAPWGEDLPAELPEDLAGIPLEYFGRALGWLADRGGVDGGRIGALGHSRGGELALLLGDNYPEVKAVVSYVGSGVAGPSPEGAEPAWTYRGEGVPHAEDPSTITKEQEERAEIPVERIHGPVLLIAAGDDTLWPSERLSRIAMERLRRHDRTYDDELVVYPKAGHAITAPYVPVADGTRFGGDEASNAEANEDSWGRVLRMLAGRLKGGGRSG